MEGDFIKIRGCRVHNLKNINLDIPKNKLVAICGLSGSGKTSLAFDTLYAEGQRRYIESLSAYVRQFLGGMKKPEVDKIEGISPAIALEPRTASRNPRSIVATVTEISDLLRLLFARVGKPHCPKCGRLISRQTIDQITESILKLPTKTKILILGPVISGRKGEHRAILEEIKRSGFLRVRIDGIIYQIEEIIEKSLARYKRHNIEVIVDKLIIEKNIDKPRLIDSLETALKIGKGVVIVNAEYKNNKKKEDLIFSEKFSCPKCGISLPEIEPRLFSFNSPYGACPACQGLGEKLEVLPELVIPDKNLSISEGAIVPWARASHKVGRQSYFNWLLSDISERYNFSLNIPVKNLPKKIINLILYGSRKFPETDFPGVIPFLEKKYHISDSEATKEEIEKYMVERTCPLCHGKRLKPEALAVKFLGYSIADIYSFSIKKSFDFFKKVSESKKLLSKQDYKISKPIIKEILNRLSFLIEVGLNYLTLDRKIETLSGGELERVKLATQIGTKLTGILYILDEPSVGLHARDQEKLILTLKNLRDLKNTVLVVEHDPQTILSSDYVIEIGPGAGRHGGKIVFQGSPKKLLKSKTITADYLTGRKKVETGEKNKIKKQSKFLIIKGAKEHNLKNINVKIPLGNFVCVTGVSGSGKSSLVSDTLANYFLEKFYKSKVKVGKFERILGIENINKVILIDQSPIGRTPRSNPATYTGAFSYIRYLFSQTREAKMRGYGPGRFSFNVKGGRCEECQGQGFKKIEMYFLPDIYIECPVCKGKRFNEETLSIEYRGKNIADILKMTVEEAMEFFKNIPPLYEKLKTLYDVGLGYIELGQPAPSLSGGEAQRVKLATELSKKATGSTLYILDEPTTGLHPDDIKKLVIILRKLVSKGNTVLITEHNLDIIKNADWIIDLGPEGGDKGGKIVFQGRFSDFLKSKNSYTAEYLRKYLSNF